MKGNGSTTATEAVKVEYIEEPVPAKPPVPWLLSPKALAAVAWVNVFAVLWLGVFDLVSTVTGVGAFLFFICVALISGSMRWPYIDR